MDQAREIKIILKFAEIDNKPFPNEQEGWVSGLVKRLRETLAFYFRRPVVFLFKKETEQISEQEFKESDVLIFVLSPAFLMSSNIAADIAGIEKAFSFDLTYINSKICKVLKGPVNIQELPTSVSMGTFHHFYQTGSSAESTYETLFEWDNSPVVKAHYWESFSNLLFDLLKNLQHEKRDRLMPESKQTVFLGKGDIDQLWNRTNLYGELNSRGVTVLPDHDYSIEVKYLNDPLKFYLEKCTAAIHFPEEFLPVSEKKLKDLAALNSLRRFIWFNSEAEKIPEKKIQYEELRQKLKSMDHIESVTSGIEELKEIIFAGTDREASQEKEAEGQPLSLYLICSEGFNKEKKEQLTGFFSQKGIQLLLTGSGKVQEKRLKHYQHLKMADFCLICYEGNSPDWVRANINEVKKAAGLRLDKSQPIKLGILSEDIHVPELIEENPFYRLLPADVPELEEELNHFVYGK